MLVQWINPLIDIILHKLGKSFLIFLVSINNLLLVGLKIIVLRESSLFMRYVPNEILLFQKA